MTMTERTVRASLVVFPAVGLVYFALVLWRLRDADAATVSWVVPMVASWIAIIVVIVAAAIASAIGTAARNHRAGRYPQEDLEDGDVRDKEIDRAGNALGYHVLGYGVAAGMILAMVDLEPFWIANGLYLASLVAGTVAAARKMRGYRDGL